MLLLEISNKASFNKKEYTIEKYNNKNLKNINR